ncbi:AraC family transcriptional regulator [Sphingomonas sp. AR_OL41]|uniref:helix-turn-helix domain-containing protein n=1 Tax=Sphingomonas sp. AR_OL41 TaxID=3042729 RepID=UPI00247FAC93|nr:AraC family transcriptional regulator [Sphingomonas sp. AR_OL41]MDH7976012.1 AraC family transcriptional regulator [Sphingomonas sp. AR_OL41]
MTSRHYPSPTGESLPAPGLLANAALRDGWFALAPQPAAPIGQPRRDETFFLRQLGVKTVLAASERVVRLQQLLRSEDVSTAAQLAEALGMSPVQLKRLCLRLFGVTPKALLIRHRLARMLAALEHRPYSELRQFLDLGYCDQSHFIRDFKAFFGMPPTRYFAGAGR